MRITVFGLLLMGMLALSGCFHHKAANPEASFAPLPGMEPPFASAEPSNVTPKTTHTAVASSRPNPTKPEVANGKSKAIVTPENGMVGKVATVNSVGRFAVLTFPVGQLPSLEQPLNVYRRGLKVGELKVTGPQIDDNIVADIVTGESEAGDEVRDK